MLLSVCLLYSIRTCARDECRWTAPEIVCHSLMTGFPDRPAYCDQLKLGFRKNENSEIYYVLCVFETAGNRQLLHHVYSRMIHTV